MTARERLFASLEGKQTDRVPIWLLFPYHPTYYYVDVRNHPDYRPIYEASKKYAIMLNRRNLGVPLDVSKLRLRKESIPLLTPEVAYRSEDENKDGLKISREYIEYKGQSIFEEIQTTTFGSKVKKPIDTDEALEFFCSLPIETNTKRLEAELEKRLTDYLREKAEFPEEYGAMMLDFLGQTQTADVIMSAIKTLTSAGRVLSPDLGGQAKTIEVGDEIVAQMRVS